MKRLLLFLMFLFFMMSTTSAFSQCTDLFISEYVEGSGFNKCLEIYNPTTNTINLLAGNYSVFISFNGGATTDEIFLTGSVASNDVYVLCDDGETLSIVPDQTDSGNFWNGNDAIELRNNGTAIDVFGQVGFDPGSEWSVGGVNTADQTLRRLSSIDSGDPNGADAFDPSAEYVEFPQNNEADLGTHTSSNCPIAPPPPAPEVPTLSQWGLIILALMFMTLGTLYIIQAKVSFEE